MPISLGMPEAFIEKNHYFPVPNSNELSENSVLYVAQELGYNVVTVSPFMSGFLAQVPLSSSLTKSNYMFAKHLNFIRSLPYSSILTTVFSAKVNRHLKSNLSVCYQDLISREELDIFLNETSARKQRPETEFQMADIF